MEIKWKEDEKKKKREKMGGEKNRGTNIFKLKIKVFK